MPLIMNKKIYALGLVLALVGFLVAPLVSATTFGFYPLKISVKEGQTFRLAVNVNPNGQKNYTIKAALQFPPDLVSVKSFSFTSQWLPLNEPGYDSLDNAAGLLIKTAGYTGGFSKAVTLGTITFTAKKSGTGVIKFTADSLALDEANSNQYSGGGQAPISIIALAPAVATPATTPSAAISATATATSSESFSATSSAALNPPPGVEAPVITLATNTPPIITPAQMKHLEDNFDNLNNNFNRLIIIFSIVAILLFIMILLGIIALLTAMVYRRRERAVNQEKKVTPKIEVPKASVAVKAVSRVKAKPVVKNQLVHPVQKKKK